MADNTKKQEEKTTMADETTLENEISKLICEHLKCVGCTICDGNITKEYCEYCVPIHCNNLFHIHKGYASIIAKEILNLINEG